MSDRSVTSAFNVTSATWKSPGCSWMPCTCPPSPDGSWQRPSPPSHLAPARMEVDLMICANIRDRDISRIISFIVNIAKP